MSEGAPIASAVEAAELFGEPPGQFLDETASRADFPAPLFAVEHKPYLARADIGAYRGRHAPDGPRVVPDGESRALGDVHRLRFDFDSGLRMDQKVV